ncbi:Hint domain-containing protein [Oceaniglobus indicus]|uniref:Hint domain-containing protein n=1 Tax=Oceaniglobus indicus TaxID=2047749 RepID=UPI000C184388|nr:Hint domain-containing protein [Oceaniglobus indicus]
MPYSRPAPGPTVQPRVSTQWNVRNRNAPATVNAPPRPTRRVSLQWLDNDGQVQDAMRLAPAIPAFDMLFSAFARGTLAPTLDGPVAVEDLMPGDTIITSDGPSVLHWVGSLTIVPGAANTESPPLSMFRIAADSLGLGRPMPDLMLGGGARILNRSGSAQADHGATGVLEPVHHLVDGENVFLLRPASPIMVYHLGFARHHTFLANGVEVESMHPGPLRRSGLEPAQIPLLMGLLPHIRQYTDLGGLVFPRQDTRERPTES